jgi:hypothetical protein
MVCEEGVPVMDRVFWFLVESVWQMLVSLAFQ